MSEYITESLYKKIFDRALIAIGVTDIKGNFILVNNTWCSQLGYSKEEANYLSLHDIIPPEDIEDRMERLQNLVNSKTDFIQKLSRYKRRDGSSFWTNLSSTSIKDDSGNVTAVLSIFQDIDAHVRSENSLKDINQTLETVNEKMKLANLEIQQKNEELQSAYIKLEEMVRTDNLTGIPNRMQLQERLLMEACRTARSKQEFCICICDIDDFKLFNDNYGHDVGDIVLQEVANIFNKYTRETDVIGRWGGEEFMLILPETPMHAAMIPMERVRVAIQAEEIVTKDKIFSVTVTMGFSCFYPDSKLEEVIKQADLALYAGKKNKKNIVIQYTKQLETIHSIYVKTQSES